MHTWILIVMLYGNSASATGHVSSVEFKSAGACERARTQLIAQYERQPSWVNLTAVCVDKGE
jgi:hypothetical protein